MAGHLVAIYFIQHQAMKKNLLLIVLALCFCKSFSQKLLVSWSQQNIENYSKDMYDQAQKLTPAELLSKNLNDESWSAVFLTLNASVNNYSKDSNYLKGLAYQITNDKQTMLEGTSRLIIWDRIISGDIIFEGKGLVMDNDLYKVGGRANQILQALTKKNFGVVTIHSTEKELEEIKNKWLDLLANKTVEVYKPVEYKNAKIPEISSNIKTRRMFITLKTGWGSCPFQLLGQDEILRLCSTVQYRL